jgi:hypothetical protein
LPVKIIRAEHFKKRLPVDSERARMQRVFRRRFEAVPEVTEEAVIVEIGEPRQRWKGDRKIEWMDKYVKDHLHLDVQRFKDLIDAKKAAGLEITVKDAVLAYVLVWGYGRKSTIAGFLWAMSDEYPEFRVKHEEIREVVKVKPLIGGPEREEVKIRRIARSVASVDELVDTVGQALSRLSSEGLILG